MTRLSGPILHSFGGLSPSFPVFSVFCLNLYLTATYTGKKITLLSDLTLLDDSTSARRLTNNEQKAPFSFSACLLTRDDNRFLPEWMAFHYQVLPLRSIVVAVDGTNLTSSEWILDQWKEMGMEIYAWREEDYFPRYERRPSPSDSVKRATDILVRRQHHFYQRCLDFLKGLNKTWTAIIDPDEFLVFNSPVDGKDQKLLNSTESNHCDAQSCPWANIPSVGKETAAGFMTKDWSLNEQIKSYPCLVFPRIEFFGSKNQSSTNSSSDRVPSGFNVNSFQTLKYHRYPARKRRIAKGIIDASKYDGRGFSVHQPVWGKCQWPDAWPPIKSSRFLVHHYVGSMEDYFSRPGDNRRSTDEYIGRSKGRQGLNENAQGWLEAFVKNVGKKKALELTEYARRQAIAEDQLISVPN